MPKIKKGDMVIVRAGKDKGRQGKVMAVSARTNQVLVEGVNLVKRHVKPNPRVQKPGGIVEKEAMIHISNVGILNPVTQKVDKIKKKLGEDGKRLRYFKSTDERVDV